jgi:predicted peptidase
MTVQRGTARRAARMIPLFLMLGATTAFPLKSTFAQETTPSVVQAGQQTAQGLEKTITRVVKADYLLYLPKDYGKDPSVKWPLMIFLHGSGESGTDVQKVKAHGPPKLIAAGKEFPFIIVSPQAPIVPRRGWSVETLNTLLDDILARYSVDQDRVYLTGLSMGGFGTWAWVSENPERFAAIAPICGGGQPRMARRIKDMPIWVFHGAKDMTVPISESEQMVEALKKAGAPEVKFTIYPDAGHDSWTATYDNPELYTWLLQHKRQAPVPAPAR